MYAYSLTGLTGRKKNADRTVIVATVEVNKFSFAVAMMALVVSLIPTLGVGMLLGPLWWCALVFPFLCVSAGLIFVDQRSKGGLQLRRYQSLVESRRGKRESEVIYVCGSPLVRPVMGRVIPQFIDAAPERGVAVIGNTVHARDGKVNVLA